MTKKQKPHDPERQAVIHQRRAERRELESRGLAVNVDPQSEKVLGAWRPDCFQMLLKNRPNEQEAIQWLETTIRTANGEYTRDDLCVQRSSDGAPGQMITAAMISAGEEVQTVQEVMAPEHIRMLFELMKPDDALLTRWRDVVKRTTGETNPQAQGAAVRAACMALVWVRRNIRLLTAARRERRLAA